MAKQKTMIMVIDREALIQSLLWKEVAHKSRASALVFSFVALFVYFYHFNLIQFKLYVQLASGLVILIMALRIWIAAKIAHQPEIHTTQKNILRFSIWINAVAWMVILTLSSYELKSTGPDFVVLISIFTGAVAGSIITLAYDKSIFFPYQMLMILPMIAVVGYQHATGIIHHGHYLMLIYSLYFLYQIRQYKDYRSQLMQRFNTQLDLEISFKELTKQTEKLIQVSKSTALSEMAGGLAHEVNNSLMVILGSTQQVQRELKKHGQLTNFIDYKLIQSKVAINKIKSVIDGLKYFSMQMEPQPKEVLPLREVIERTLTYSYELLKAHGIEITVGEVPEVNILCQPFQITQILFNITKNADDAMVDNIGDKWLRYDFEITKSNVLIKVSNNGAPIRPQNITKLFQPFFSTKDVNQGTGLSLSSAKGMAMDHKGDLYFEDGRYTKFVLKLPLA
jgi:signal transduction histidine kinase